MGQFRRTTLAALLFFNAISAQATLGASPLKLEMPEGPGSLGIINVGNLPVTIARAISVERLEQGNWHPITTEFNAVASCAIDRTPSPIVLAPKANLHVARWRGFSCSGQCVGACRANQYYGGVTFRFVVKTISPVEVSVIGPKFALPTRPVN